MPSGNTGAVGGAVVVKTDVEAVVGEMAVVEAVAAVVVAYISAVPTSDVGHF